MDTKDRSQPQPPKRTTLARRTFVDRMIKENDAHLWLAMDTLLDALLAAVICPLEDGKRHVDFTEQEASELLRLKALYYKRLRGERPRRGPRPRIGP